MLGYGMRLGMTEGIDTRISRGASSAIGKRLRKQPARRTPCCRYVIGTEIANPTRKRRSMRQASMLTKVEGNEDGEVMHGSIPA